MATTLIDYNHQSQTWTTIAPYVYMWDHVLVTYDNIERSGNTVTIKGLYMRGWWDAGTASGFVYYGTFTYGAKLIVNGREVTWARTTKNAGGTVPAGQTLFEQGGMTATFNLPAGKNTIQVQVQGTDEFSFSPSAAITVTIPPGIDPPGPTSGSIRCSLGSGSEGANKATVSFSGLNFNCPAGNVCHNSTSIKVSPGGYSSSGRSLTMSNLQPNTKYTARGTASNGTYSSSSTCSFTTLTSSNAFGYRYRTDQVSQLSINVDKGGNACATSTKVYIREKGGSWTQVHSTTGYGIETFQLRNLITRGKKYEAKTESTNCAGTYVSPVYNFEPPAADNIIGLITSLDSELEEESKGQSVQVNYCWDVTSALLAPVSEDNPITVYVQYRIKGQGEWQDSDAVTMTTDHMTACGSLPHLTCSAEYEFRLLMQNGNTKVYSAIRTLATAICADYNICTCDTLEYMTELICQEFNRVKNGMKTIYANCDAKDLCDPYSKNPTWASILSRVLRYFQSIVCILCSMDTLQMAVGEDDQIYTATEPGQAGAWETLVNDAEENNGHIISSDGAKKAIDYFVASVWHPIGIYDYFVWKEADIPLEAPEPKDGETLVMGENWYEYRNNAWVDKGKVKDLAPFGTILIKQGTDYANHEFYWFADEWNLLDFERGPMAEKIALYEGKDDLVTNQDAGGLKIQHNLANFDYSTLPCERTACFVVEDMNLPAIGSHRVTFPTEPNATIIQYQDVIDGGLAQKPEDPTRTGFTFTGWKNGNTGATFDWDAPIHADVEVIAQWTPQEVTVAFDINGATGATPASITAHYGDTIAALPDDTGFALAGATFHGWARDGVPFTSTTQLVGDTTLVAVWHMDEFDVTFHPENGEDNIVTHIVYGSSPAEPTAPTRTDYLFKGWFTSPIDGTGAEFVFPTYLYGPTDIYARWIKANYTVTFDSAGGTAVDAQTVNYMGIATEPTAPTKADYVFGWWMLGGYRYNFSQPINRDITLVAKWLETYTIKFVDTFGDQVAPDQQVIEGSAFGIIFPPDPVREGYTFEGWYAPDGHKWNPDVDIVSSDMTMTAVFKANS